MTNLLVAGFKGDMHKASRVLDELRVLDDEWILDIRDTVAVHRNLHGALTMDNTYQPTGRMGIAWSRILGLVIGGTLTSPSLADASAPVLEGISVARRLGRSTRASVGLSAYFLTDGFSIPDLFVREACALLAEGDSAIYGIAGSSDPDQVLAYFEAYGATIARTALSSVQRELIENALDQAIDQFGSSAD
jgi:uncharacterized membrane protein